MAREVFGDRRARAIKVVQHWQEVVQDFDASLQLSLERLIGCLHLRTRPSMTTLVVQYRSTSSQQVAILLDLQSRLCHRQLQITLLLIFVR